MTSPFAKKPSQSTLRERWLGKYLMVESKSLSAIHGILVEASQDAYKEIISLGDKDGIGAIARRSQLASTMAIIREINHDIFLKFGNIIRDGNKDAAEAAVDALGEDERKFVRAIFGSTDKAEDWLAGQRTSAVLGVAHAISRHLYTTIPLSRRVYRSESLSNGYVERIVNSALVTGASSREIAQRVKQHINPATPGGVSFAAMRLGRTELNNAFHATSIELMQDRPWVESADWNLSKRHDEIIGCKCEEYARLRTFPVDQIPRKPHPQCRCYTTPNLMDWQAFENNLLIGMYDGYVTS